MTPSARSAAGVEGPGDVGVAVPPDVRVVDPADVDLAAVRDHLSARVRSTGRASPPRRSRFTRSPQGSRAAGARRRRRAPSGSARACTGTRRVVVVGAEDEDAGPLEQRARGRSATVGTASRWARKSPVTTTRSGSSASSEETHAIRPRVPGRQVQVGEVQHPQRRLAGGEHRRASPAAACSGAPRRPSRPDRRRRGRRR